MSQIQIFEYLRPDGGSPFYEWLHRDIKEMEIRGRIRQKLARVRSGNLRDYKSVGNGVCEMRLAMGPGYQIYFGRSGTEIVILLCAGTKGTQAKDIIRAHGYWEDFKRRNLA